MTAQTDAELSSWIFGIWYGKPFPSGDFLRPLIEAAMRADPENYAILRPALLEIQRKYPKYRFE